jgi:hypothetical protein
MYPSSSLYFFSYLSRFCLVGEGGTPFVSSLDGTFGSDMFYEFTNQSQIIYVTPYVPAPSASLWRATEQNAVKVLAHRLAISIFRENKPHLTTLRAELKA